MQWPAATQLGQPCSALVTAAISSLMRTVPSPSASAFAHTSDGELPKAMFTAAINSLIDTVPSPSQSPKQPRVGMVCVGSGVDVSVDPGGTVGVRVGVSVIDGVAVAVEPRGTVSVAVALRVGVGVRVIVAVGVTVCVGSAAARSV